LCRQRFFPTVLKPIQIVWEIRLGLALQTFLKFCLSASFFRARNCASRRYCFSASASPISLQFKPL
jgi:hypothetical protein